jgi:hypothetical protein
MCIVILNNRYYEIYIYVCCCDHVALPAFAFDLVEHSAEQVQVHVLCFFSSQIKSYIIQSY